MRQIRSKTLAERKIALMPFNAVAEPGYGLPEMPHIVQGFSIIGNFALPEPVAHVPVRGTRHYHLRHQVLVRIMV